MALRIWLPLNGDLRNQGVSDVTITPSTSAAVQTDGKIGKCYRPATITLTNLDDFSFNNSSFCFWAKTSATTSWQLIIGIDNSNLSQIHGIYVADTSRYKLEYNPSLNIYNAEIAQWHHYAFIIQSGKSQAYCDGVLKATSEEAVTDDVIGRLRLGVGTAISLNDVRIYDHALSAAEVREVAQGLVLHYKLDDLENGVLDSSGYGHHGSILGTATLSSDSAHYNSSITLPSGANAINCGRGGMVTDSITVNIWIKATGWGNPVSCTEGGGWNFEADGDYFRFPVYISGVGYKYGKSTHTRAQICNGQWHMLTGIYDKINQKVQIYVDGQLDNDYAAGTSNNIGYNGSNVIWIGAEASSSATAYASRQMVGSFSDFRIYCTALDADAVRQLYEVGAKIDNKANFHTFEINENGTNKLTKTGIMHDNMEESIMTLPDGSCWQLLLFHYVDSGNNLFTSSNATNCNDFGLFSRLKDIDKFKIGTQYEFYGIQDGNTYRWIQTNAPLTTTAVTGFSAVNGYTSPGAGLCKCNGNTVLARTNTTSNWWNAVGCYTKYGSGIPGYAQTLCTRYMALYARIEKADVKISNQTLNASEIIEL